MPRPATGQTADSTAKPQQPQQPRTLATLRDTLLPKLLNGEMSVREMNTEEVATV